MELNLRNKKWKEFLIEDLFIVSIGKNVDGNKIDKLGGNIAYVTRKENNNGLDGFIDFNENFINSFYPVITIGNETAEPFVQNYLFYTGTKVNILTPKIILSREVLNFICVSLRCHKSKYSYSYTINSARLRRQKILLPVTIKNEPDYDFMEQYICQKKVKKSNLYKEYITKRIIKFGKVKEVEPLSVKKWKEFYLHDLFNFEKGDQNNMAILINGDIPLVSAKKGDNGYKSFVTNNNKQIFPKNCLTLNNDGDGGAGISFYQPYKFTLDSHVTALFHKSNLNNHILLFISRCITSQRDKFGHGYSLTNNRLQAFKMMLPINIKGEPDYEYMEQYMKALEYSKLRTYLDWKNNHM
ncbi:MAG: restriction endonuclease subunit S [Dysgonomonas sp.]